jgi:hypothetical protein
MTGEFTAYCNHYYDLTQQLTAREGRFKNLLDNVPLYCGQTSLSEVDDIISYYRQVQAAKAKVDETCDEMRETERAILMFMQHFEMPTGTVLTGEIPGELQYEIWANENDTLYINKTKDLAPTPDDLNVIEIRLWGGDDVEEEEEE